MGHDRGSWSTHHRCWLAQKKMMKGSNFTFKQFVVAQQGCAMKVGTDGVLLGAWAEQDRELAAKPLLRILDIGTGTGLIALMMAQRFPEATIDAIDLDPSACQQAQANAEASPFGSRIRVVQSAAQAFTAEQKYDSIVSNPPFFTNGQRSDEQSRALARHADTLPYAALFQAVDRLLADDGRFSAIIPADNYSDFAAEGYLHGFSVVRHCTIRTTEHKPPRRCLVAFGRKAAANAEKESVVLQDADGKRTEWYKILTKNFYIK